MALKEIKGSLPHKVWITSGSVSTDGPEAPSSLWAYVSAAVLIVGAIAFTLYVLVMVAGTVMHS